METNGRQLQWRSLKSQKVTLSELLSIVNTSDKKRFALLHIPSAADSSNAKTQATAGIIQDEEGVTGEEGQGPIIGAVPTTNTAEQEDATGQALSVQDADPSHFLIRATQGHSIKSVDAASYLERLGPSSALPDTVVHGSYCSTWPSIVAYGGLRCMGRNHVHFATGPSLKSVLSGLQGGIRDDDGPVISGMRQNSQILIYIDLREALKAGCPFWRSENGVILSEGIPKKKNKDEGAALANEDDTVVPLKFFQVVVEKKHGLGVIWEHGKEVQSLPPKLTKRGKGSGMSSK